MRVDSNTATVLGCYVPKVNSFHGVRKHLSHIACSGFCLAAITGLSLSALADQNLTLELPPSQAARDARLAKQSADQAAHTSVVPHHLNRFRTVSRGSYPSRGGVKRESVVGKLGQVSRAASIYRGRSSQSPRMTDVPAGTYVAVQEQVGDWYGVLMADGSTGWLPREKVRSMDYQVVSSATTNTTPMGSNEGDIYPRSSTPYFTGDPQPLLAEAYKYLGVRYVWGGNTSTGIDCSGFIKNIFGALGYSLPRLGSEQMAYGIPVSETQLQPGDRLYFGRRHDRIGVTHTGLYIGNGYFIHSSSSRGGVAISNLSEPMFARIYVCARR